MGHNSAGELIIVGFAGQRKAGKDTCSDFLVNLHHEVTSWSATKMSVVAGLRDICRKYLNMTEEQISGNLKESASNLRWDNIHVSWAMKQRGYMTNREILQYVGQCLTDLYAGIWTHDCLDACESWMDSRYNGGNHIIALHDVRRIDEIEILRRYSDCQRTRVFLYLVKRGEPNTDMHSSEREILTVPEHKFDAVIENDGDLKDLHGKVSDLYRTQIIYNLFADIT